ncbi:MAG: hypothetical protein WCS77_08860 [Elusimicrobiaceae bacterium]
MKIIISLLMTVCALTPNCVAQERENSAPMPLFSAIKPPPPPDIDMLKVPYTPQISRDLWKPGSPQTFRRESAVVQVIGRSGNIGIALAGALAAPVFAPFFAIIAVYNAIALKDAAAAAKQQPRPEWDFIWEKL